MPNDAEPPPTRSEARRLEELWAGRFGDAYTKRNTDAGAGRGAFWERLLTSYEIHSVIEVGCNIGANLQWIRRHVEPSAVYGIDVNHGALRTLRQRLPDVNAIWSPARELPIRDRWFDLAFTSGALIHQPESTLPLVMSELVRVSRRYVLAMEYHDDSTTEVPYRGEQGALFKRDYRALYDALFPGMRVVDGGFLAADTGWDDVTWTLFTKD